MREREEQQMNNRKKMIVGIASLAGAACAAGVTAKVADCIKRNDPV